MKKLSVLLLAAMLPLQGIAAELKIGVVDYGQVISGSSLAKKIEEEMKAEFKPRQDKIVNLEKDMKEKAEKLQRNGAIMSEAEKSKLEKELMSHRREMQNLQEAFREDFSMRNQEETKKLMDKAQKVIDQIAAKHHYDLILRSEAAPFATKTLNVTEEAIKMMG